MCQHSRRARHTDPARTGGVFHFPNIPKAHHAQAHQVLIWLMIPMLINWWISPFDMNRQANGWNCFRL
jgi:hypothetical protein